jgi:acetylornithine aminotransferase
VITLAKGLGGGLPLGAMIALGDAATLFIPGDHGSTFGGNPVATAAGLAVISTIEKNSLLERVSAVGVELMAELALIDGVKEVRGAGLLIGIEFTEPIAKQVTKTLEKLGILVNGNSEHVIRIAPPLIVTDRQISKFITAFATSVDKVRGL